MSDISKITLPNGGAYDLKDAQARLSCTLLSASKADVSSVSKVFIKDPGEQEYADGKQSDLSVFKLTNAEYAQLVVQSQTQPNAQYIISDEYFDVFGQKIKNVASPTDLSDAVNKEYVDSNFQPAGSYLTAVPDAYKTYAATLSSLSSTYSLTSHTHAGYASSTHTHGNMQNGGTLQTTDVTIASGDKLVVTDASNSNKIARASAAFDGSTTTKFLSQKGTFETALTAHQSLTGYVPTSRKVAGQALTADIATATLTSELGLGNYVPTSRKVAGQALTADVAASTISTAIGLNGYVPTSRKVAGKSLTADIAASELSSAIGLGDYSLTSHTHTNYVPTSRKVAGMQLTGDVTLKNLSFGTKNYNGSTALTVTAGDIGALTAHQAVSAAYADQHIKLSANGAVVGDIDCSDFVKDGMLSTVELCSDQLIFKFNTASGKSDISIALSNFIDETNYYTKAELTGSSGVLASYSLTSHTHTNYALTSHVHGNVTSGGTLTATGVALANNDALVIVDSSDSSKIKKTAITFDGSTTTQFLSKKGTWQTALTAHQSLAGYVPTSRTVAGQQLTANVTAATISSAIGLAGYSLTSHTHAGYVPTSRTVAGMQLTGNVTLKNLSFGSKNYNGSTALTVALADIGAAAATHQHTASYTPAGTIGTPTISLATAGSTTSVNNPTKKTVVTSATQGSLQTLTASVENGDTLVLSLTGGALPTFTTGDSITTTPVTVKTGDASYSSSQPSFTGTAATLTAT